MPVTTDLSRRLYETLGDEVADELVRLLNRAEAASPPAARELTDATLARFDANVKQRLEHSQARLERLVAELRSEFQTRSSALDWKLTNGLAGLRAELHEEIEGQKTHVVKWTFLFFTGTALVNLLIR